MAKKKGTKRKGKTSTPREGDVVLFLPEYHLLRPGARAVGVLLLLAYVLKPWFTGFIGSSVIAIIGEEICRAFAMAGLLTLISGVTFEIALFRHTVLQRFLVRVVVWIVLVGVLLLWLGQAATFLRALDLSLLCFMSLLLIVRLVRPGRPLLWTLVGLVPVLYFLGPVLHREAGTASHASTRPSSISSSASSSTSWASPPQ